jgi:predicted phage terminase large subunit-like protein
MPSGCLLRQGGWDHLELPAIALEDQIIELGHGKSHLRRIGDVLHPQRESREALEGIKTTMSSLIFSAQYQQRPVPLEGNLIKRASFKYFDPAALPAPTWQTRIVLSLDVAMQTGETNDYSVCPIWRVEQNNFYLLDVFRGRLEYPDLRRKVIALAQERRPTTILIEDAGPGMNLLQDLRASMPTGLTCPIGIKPEGDKIQRMAAQAAKIEAGQVYLPQGASWLAEFLSELLAFPHGRHDDQVDSVSQFLRWWQNSVYAKPISWAVPIIISRRREFP